MDEEKGHLEVDRSRESWYNWVMVEENFKMDESNAPGFDEDDDLEEEFLETCECFYVDGRCIYCGRAVNRDLDPRNEPEWQEEEE